MEVTEPASMGRMKALLFAIAITTATPALAAQPNLLFLFADDMTWKAVRNLGGEDIDTPNLDRLAARGTVFTHAYNPGGWHGALCVASRTMLMTGKQLWRARDAEPRLGPDYVERQRLLPQRLAQAGYRTCFSGKWHIEADHRKVFGEIRHFRPGGMPEDHLQKAKPAAYFRPVEGRDDPWDAADPAEGGMWQGGRHWSEVVADDFAHFLASGDPRPWFMYLAFNAPHDPRQAPREVLDRYPLERVRVPRNFLPLYPHRESMGAGEGLRDEDLAPFPRTPFAVKTHRREYFAAITHLDQQIGRILEALDRSPGARATYVIFTADHGLACGEHGLMGKQNLYDASVRVPLLVAGPDVPAGKKVDAPVYLQDVMPTLLELAGVPAGEEVDFQDLRPLWKGGGKRRDAVIGAYRDLQRMIERDGKKLILYPRAGVARLYDLKADPDEQHDLMDTADGGRIAAALFRRLVEIQRETGDPLDLRPHFPKWAVE
jgi:choline-sulfatase